VVPARGNTYWPGPVNFQLHPRFAAGFFFLVPVNARVDLARFATVSRRVVLRAAIRPAESLIDGCEHEANRTEKRLV
jgi:hypothetical protein